METKELVAQLNAHRKEVADVRKALNELDAEKESWFKKKEEVSAKIRASIQKIKENKAKRDSLTQEVKDLKPKRDVMNKEVSSKLQGLDTLKKETSSLKFSGKNSPDRLKEQFEKLSFKLETEPMSFDKEQALMKKIKQLKKEYTDMGYVLETRHKLHETSSEVRKARKEANEAHKSIQEKAKESQMLHEEILKLSAEIDKMKVEEEEYFKKFIELKNKFSESYAQLKEKTAAMNAVRDQLDKIGDERKEKKKHDIESILKSKEEAVNEKIKKGEKLTTEDLLVFQQKFGRE